MTGTPSPAQPRLEAAAGSPTSSAAPRATGWRSPAPPRPARNPNTSLVRTLSAAEARLEALRQHRGEQPGQDGLQHEEAVFLDRHDAQYDAQHPLRRVRPDAISDERV